MLQLWRLPGPPHASAFQRREREEPIHSYPKRIDQLAEEILASQEKVAKAREDGDPELTREALREVNEIRRRLTNSIEEIVYREGLESKMNEWLSDEGKPARSIEVASAGTGDDEFLNQLALTLDLEQRSFTEGMKEITGKGSNGLVNKVVAAMFEDRSCPFLPKATRPSRY